MQKLNWNKGSQKYSHTMELCTLSKNASFTEINVVKMFQHCSPQVNVILVYHTFVRHPNNGTPSLPFSI